MHNLGRSIGRLGSFFPFIILLMVAVFSSVGCTPDRPVDVVDQEKPTDESKDQSPNKDASENSSSQAGHKEHKEVPEDEFNNLETVKFDWDGDGNPETFVMEHRKGWNDFLVTRLSIDTVKNGPYVFENYVEGWAKYKYDAPEHLMRVGNLADSEYLFFLKVTNNPENLPLLFVFGPQYASSPPSLDIFSIEGGSPHPIFSGEYFSLGVVKDIDGDGKAEMIGSPCYGEVWGPSYTTYNPTQVYQLPEKSGSAVLSLELSEKYNREYYYGWAGPNCSSDPLVVEKPPDGGPPRIMSKEEADKLFAKKP